MRDRITFECPDGSIAGAYMATDGDTGTGIVVLQEWWGLNPQICDVADRFAGAGFAAVAPDLYHGRVTQDRDEASHMMTGLDWVGAVNIEVHGAIDLLRKDVDRVAVMGFCMGGALSIIAGTSLSACDAVVCYYGIPPKEQADPAQFSVPFLGHFATRDNWCTPAAVDGLETALKASGAPYELHRYDADHGFFNDTVAAYDEDAAELSWHRTLDFLKAHL